MELASRDVISRAEQTEIDEGRGVDGNVLTRSAAPRRREDPRAAARDARALDGLRRRRSDLRPDSGAAGRALPHGRRRHRLWGRTSSRAVRRGRVRVRLRSRREPARRQRADGDDHVRQASGTACGRVGAREHGRRGAGVRGDRCRARFEGAARPGPTASVRGRSATSSAQTMHENFGVFRREEQMLRQGEIVDGLRERYERVVVEDKGEVFNSDLTQALELGFLLDLADCMIVGRRRAQGESRRARAAVRLSGPRRRELPQAHARHARRSTGGRSSTGSP